MKKILSIIFFLLLTIDCFCQNKLLTKKIVYTLSVTDNSVKMKKDNDTILYEYKVNRRFWWEAMESLTNEIKTNKLSMYNSNGQVITWDSMTNELSKQLKVIYGKTLNKKEIQEILDNEIRKIEFEEEWTYNPSTMLIDKKVISYTPIISRDSVALVGEEMQVKEYFSFPIGKIYPKNLPNKDTILICRDIRYTMPIYNSKPYRWWDSNLEAEYSIPYFDDFFHKAETGLISVYDNPDIVDALTKGEIIKRREYSKNETIIKNLTENNISETDTTIKLTYNSEDIDFLRFGEEIYFDKINFNFIKTTNYIAPVVRIFATDGSLIGFYPIYYIRKR
ncbi:MAG: hypothetical protein IJ213_00035 [Bacteroidales bacterium]|nr:hypothetical protein [Bacteroidales bacterium]